MDSRGRKGTGLVLLIISVIAFFAYAYVLLVSPWAIEILEITVLGAVSCIISSARMDRLYDGYST